MSQQDWPPRAVGPTEAWEAWPPAPPPEAWLPPPAHRPRYALALLLFLATLVTTTALGSVWFISTRTDLVTDLSYLDPTTVLRVWRQPALLRLGLQYSLPVLFILLCHELGHYVACRRYRLPATLPYFLPFPFLLGTLGAFIRIRAPIRTKRELFDVGAAGPIAGFLALLPFLVYGVAQSAPAPLLRADPERAQAILLIPQRPLAMELVTRLFHGELPPDHVLDLHPFALAAWLGLFATALNLLPLGQLDGGHILYAAVGRLQRRLALPVVLALAAAGLFWTGWFLWCLVALLMGLRHPPLRDETAPLGATRQALAGLCLLLFALCFLPVPADIAFVGP